MLTAQEALIALAEGKKIARRCWDEGYIYMKDGLIVDESYEEYETQDFNGFALYQERKTTQRCIAIMPGSLKNYNDGTFWVVCNDKEEAQRLFPDALAYHIVEVNL